MENIEDKINIHIAKSIIDDNAIVYKNSVLSLIEVDDIVRISFELINDNDMYWYHDAPYVKIIKIHSDKLLGEIQNINRLITNKYPLANGECIWFNFENVIEIPRRIQSSGKFNSHLTTTILQCTGPLFTICSDDSEYTESGNNSSYTDCSEGESDDDSPSDST